MDRRSVVTDLDVEHLQHYAPPERRTRREGNLLHARVGLDRRHAALREHLARVQHRHGLRERPHEVHVVLDDDDGALLGDVLQEPPGLVLLLGAHPGSYSMSSLASCTSSMPISSHCFWPCGRMPAGTSRVGEADRLQRRGHLVGHPGPAAQQRQRAAAATGRDVEVPQHRQLLEHRRGLERAADAEPGDPVHLPADQLMPANRPTVAAPDRRGVDQSGLLRVR